MACSGMSALDSINPSLTRYGRRDPAPVLPLREEPDLLSWLETSGRLVADEESGSPEVSTVEEEELSALMRERGLQQCGRTERRGVGRLIPKRTTPISTRC